MTTDTDYITTTGERWFIATRGAYILCRDNPDNERHIRNGDILAELRALRAQRDELLALVRHAAEDSCVTTSDDPGCFYCDWSEHRADCPVRPFLIDPITRAKGEA